MAIPAKVVLALISSLEVKTVHKNISTTWCNDDIILGTVFF